MKKFLHWDYTICQKTLAADSLVKIKNVNLKQYNDN